MRWLALLAALIASPVAAQLANPPTFDSEMTATTCPNVTGTISAAGQTITMVCPTAGSYTVLLTTPAGQADFNGSLSSASSNGSPKRWMRTGVAPLDVSTLTFTGQPMGSRYYTISGGRALVIAASAYTSGQVTVTIGATPAVLYPIINGETQTSSVVALLNGRGFTSTFPNGSLNVANASYACLYIRNTSTETRGIWEARVLSNDVLGGQTPAKYFVINNPTGTLPTTAATVAARGAAGYTSAMTVTYGTQTALPTGTATGGYVPTNGTPYVLPLEKTIEPGAGQAMCIAGVNPSGGVGATSNPAILFGWREQSGN